MSDVIDLSSLKKNGPDLDSLSTEQQEALAAMAEENEPEGEQVTTAFLVIVSRDGSAMAVQDINYPVTLDRPASVDDIYGAVNVVAKDIRAQETALHTVNAMQQVAMAQMQARANQKIVSQLGLQQ